MPPYAAADGGLVEGQRREGDGSIAYWLDLRPTAGCAGSRSAASRTRARAGNDRFVGPYAEPHLDSLLGSEHARQLVPRGDPLSVEDHRRWVGVLHLRSADLIRGDVTSSGLEERSRRGQRGDGLRLKLAARVGTGVPSEPPCRVLAFVSISLDTLWRTALRDADLPCGVPVRLLTFDGAAPPGEPWGSYVQPGVSSFGTLASRFPFFAEHIDQARIDQPFHQILLRTGAPPHVLLGVMRHELEHLRQFLRDPGGSTLGGVAARALERSVAPLSGAFFPLYGVLPNEIDANAAATSLVTRALGPPPEELVHGTHASLLTTSASSGSPESLTTRMLGVAALFHDTLADAAHDALAGRWPVNEALAVVLRDLAIPDAGELFAAVLLDDGIAHLRDRLPLVLVSGWTLAGITRHGRLSVGTIFSAAGVRAMRVAADPVLRSRALATLQLT